MEVERPMPRLGHAGLTVSDLDVSIRFYCDIVGFELSLRTRVAGAWFDTLTENRDAEIEIAMLMLDDFTLQLVQYHCGGGERLGLAHHRVGSPHLSIEVHDVEERHAAITATGGHDATPVVDIMGTGIRSFYVHDPDGVPIELLQMPA